MILRLLGAALISACLAVLCGTASESDPAMDLAASVISKVTTGDIRGAVAPIHEPATYDMPHQLEDRGKVADHLEFLLKQFGDVSSPRLARSAVTFYKLEMAGGDVPYWQSQPNFGVAATAIYFVNFSRVGPGVVAIALTRASGYWELRSIALGLEANRPQSRETMMRIGRALLAQGDPSMSKEQIAHALESLFGPPQAAEHP